MAMSTRRHAVASITLSCVACAAGCAAAPVPAPMTVVDQPPTALAAPGTDASCNVGLSDAQEHRWDNFALAAKRIAAGYGLSADCYGDPRGTVVKLTDANDESAGDIWGGGWGVY